VWRRAPGDGRAGSLDLWVDRPTTAHWSEAGGGQITGIGSWTTSHSLLAWVVMITQVRNGSSSASCPTSHRPAKATGCPWVQGAVLVEVIPPWKRRGWRVLTDLRLIRDG
jgi:hypothetical protein